MLAIVNGLGALGAWAAGLVAVKWGYKVALVAAIVAVYVTVWVAIAAVLAALVALLPASPFGSFLLQFFPTTAAVSAACGAYFGTMATLRSLEYWKAVSGIAAKVGA